MEKRIFLAIAISIAVLLGWSAIAPRLFPELAKKPAVKPVATDTTATRPPVDVKAPPADTAIAAAPPASPVAATAQQHTIVDTPQYTAVFSNRGAQLISFKLKNYKQKRSDELVDLVKARGANRTDFPFTIVPRDPSLKRLNTALYSVSDQVDPKGQRVIQYRYSDGRVSMTKTFRFAKQPYLFDFNVTMTPPSPYRVAIGPGIRTLAPEEQDSQVVTTGNGVVEANDKFRIVRREKAPAFHVVPSIQYIGIEDNYFLSVLRPSRGAEGSLQKVQFSVPQNKTGRADLYAAVNATGDGVVAGDSFFGPKETKVLDAYGLGEALQLGYFGLIARFFLRALLYLNQFTHNYGWAIIVLTIVIKLVLYPLQHKQNVSMKKMQRVQPKVEAIKAKYKKARSDAEQRNKMNVEMMALYQKEGINPMAGCLPLVLQLPIVWGFYGLLSRAIELRGAPFILWMHDLSEKDPYYITPILMTATMFLQTYLMPSTGDPSQRRMFLIMPLFFGFFFKDFPSGVVLYWLVQNILTIAQQWAMNKWWKDHPPAVQNA
ncbi:MAG: membrane protein insertase YidC [Acidobacteriota bacterium]|nr:membrane protein insertase YidC [Acidobacteriota bacterium]